jgi:SAM-dependent methyltransferase
MAGWRNKAGAYLRAKLGLTALQYKVDQQLSFQLSLLNFASPAVLNPDVSALDTLRDDLKDSYGVHEFSPVIHKNDLMFQHHLYHHPDISEALKHYFRVGASISKELAGIFQLAPDSRLLDFGAGYGRLTRFLPGFFKGVEVQASEVKPESLQFLKEQFGIPGILHGTDPESFPYEKFDAILALSVFTHLPEALFQSWLERLSGALKEGGQMMITWNDISRKPAMSGKDFHYSSHSEDSFFRTSDRLESDEEYGLTFVSASFLQNLAEQLGLQADFSHQGFTGSQRTCLMGKR